MTDPMLDEYFDDTPEPLTDSGLRYVNAYLVSRRCGGPEEGGWWYDAGEPLASVPVGCRDIAAIEEWRVKLTDMFSDRASKSHRSSVFGGPDLEVYIEEHPAWRFPADRPYYE